MLTSALRRGRGGLSMRCNIISFLLDDFNAQDRSFFFLFSVLPFCFPPLRFSFRFLPHTSYHSLTGRADCHGLIPCSSHQQGTNSITSRQHHPLDHLSNRRLDTEAVGSFRMGRDQRGQHHLLGGERQRRSGEARGGGGGQSEQSGVAAAAASVRRIAFRAELAGGR